MINAYRLKRDNAFGYDVLRMTVNTDTIAFECYELWQEQSEQQENLIAGETLDASLRGNSYIFAGASTLTLDSMRSQLRFCDMACFGIDPTGENAPLWADTNPLSREMQAYPWLLNHSRLVKIVFPDTESNFLECLITVPSAFGGKPFIVLCNQEIEAGEMQDAQIASPVLNMTAPESVIAGDDAVIEISVSPCRLGLESLYIVTVDCSNGYIARRQHDNYT